MAKYPSYFGLVGASPPMRKLQETIERLAKFKTTVLITGESGSGKELVARALHEASPYKGRPFVAVNCGAIPADLLESELFGHKKGAFTDAVRDKMGLFEEAQDGTLFLDEVAELPLSLQVKLLRVLQEKAFHRVGDEKLSTFSARLITATHKELLAEVKKKRFREDLYYRLHVVTVEVPSLRDRRLDIEMLVSYLIEACCKKNRIPKKSVHPLTLRVLQGYSWPGNVRELQNVIEQMIVFNDSSELTVEFLPETLKSAVKHLLPKLKKGGKSESATERAKDGSVLSGKAAPENLSIKKRTVQLEVELIKKALALTAGNRTHAAKILEISHRALLYKLKEYSIE